MRIAIFVILSLNFAFANWIGNTSYDKMDDVTTSYITSSVVESVAYRYGKDIIPSLIIRNNGTSREVYIAMEEYVGNIDEIIVRFDKNSKKTIRVSKSTDHKALFLWGNEIESFIKNMQKANRLLIKYTPYSENPRVAEFDLKGFTKAYNKYIDPLKNKKRDNSLLNKNNKKQSTLISTKNECLAHNGDWEWNGIINKWECLGAKKDIKSLIYIDSKNECEANNGDWEWNGIINKWECLG